MPPSPSVHHIPSFPGFTSRARLARLSSKDTAALFNLSPFRVNQAEYNCKAQVKITTFRHSSKIQNLSITWTLITASTTLASSLSFLGKALLAKHQELNWLTWFLLEVSLQKTWPPSPSWSPVGWALPKTFAEGKCPGLEFRPYMVRPGRILVRYEQVQIQKYRSCAANVFVKRRSSRQRQGRQMTLIHITRSN